MGDSVRRVTRGFNFSTKVESGVLAGAAPWAQRLPRAGRLLLFDDSKIVYFGGFKPPAGARSRQDTDFN